MVHVTAGRLKLGADSAYPESALMLRRDDLGDVVVIMAAGRRKPISPLTYVQRQPFVQEGSTFSKGEWAGRKTIA